ncbi:MAG: VacJ family lipoprotein [bacterium]
MKIHPLFIIMILMVMMISLSAIPFSLAENLTPAEEEVFDDFGEFGFEVTEIQKPVFDPLRGYNRVMFYFNDKVYFWVLKPIGKGYGKVVPEPARLSIKRFFHNLKFPIRLVNNILQFKLKGAGRETARFIANSTIGFLGFFDPARTWWNLQPSEEDFGQTLGFYGVGEGFPITLPFLGPSNLRDTLSLVPDYYLNPISYVNPEEKRFFDPVYIGIHAFQMINETSLSLDVYENIKKNALDPYTFVRDAYKQNRDKKIKE